MTLLRFLLYEININFLILVQILLQRYLFYGKKHGDWEDRRPRTLIQLLQKETLAKILVFRNSRSQTFTKKVFLKILQNTQEITRLGVSFKWGSWLLPCNFIKKETPAQMFSWEFCEIFKSTFFIAHLGVNSSDSESQTQKTMPRY